MLYWITPSLALSEAPRPGDAPVVTMGPARALATIQGGQDAVVRCVEDVYTVLSALGLNDDEIADKVDFAMGLSH